MEINYYEWPSVIVLNKALEDYACQNLIDIVPNWEKATVESKVRGHYSLNNEVRQSKVYFSDEKWIIELVWKYIEIYKEITGLNYDVVIPESVQITKYEEGDYFDYHIDGSGSHFPSSEGTAKFFNNFKVRKISMTFQLNEEYEGGDYQFAYCEKGKLKTETVERSKGAVILFPSFLNHCITPVTKGVRYSLVAWVSGPPFK